MSAPAHNPGDGDAPWNDHVTTLVPTTSVVWLAPVLAAPFVGSFLALVAVRLPAGERIALGRSKCRHCGRTLGVRDLIPIASWLALAGRCRTCGGQIGALHPLVEVGAVAIAVWSASVVPGWLAWVGCGLGWALLVLAAIDWRSLVLPDEITLPLVVAGLGFVALEAREDLPGHVLGAAAGFGAFAAIAWGYQRLRGRRGLGLGDAKLMAAAGAWVSWVGLPSVVAIAAALALVGVGVRALGSRLGAGRPMSGSDAVAFGPYLALGIWCVWLYGPLRIGLF